MSRETEVLRAVVGAQGRDSRDTSLSESSRVGSGLDVGDKRQEINDDYKVSNLSQTVSNRVIMSHHLSL